MSHFGNIGHHLIVAIIDHIPNGWVMFNGDMTNDPCLWQYIGEASIGMSLVRDWLISAQQTDPSLFSSKVGRVEAAGSLKVFHLSPPIWHQTL